MKKIWTWLRTLNAGEWIALAVLVIASLVAGWGAVSGIWSAIVGSLQPELVKVKRLDYDLIAQRSMSAAAWWMVACTIVSVLVSALAVVLVSLNLREARIMTREAKRSADLAEQSVAASRQGIAATREAGKAQTRAYLMVSRAHIEKQGSHQSTLEVDFKNAGQTPALRVSMSVFVWTEAENVEELVLESWDPTFDLAPGDQDSLRFSSIELAQKLDGLKFDDRLKVSVKIEITYEDVFAETQVAEASFWGNGRHRMSGVELSRDMEEYELL